MSNLKERVLVFSDAIIAIILTIMVLEIPIKYASSGDIVWQTLLSAVGIYFISFCFVANLWFQTAYAFNRIEQVKNKSLVVYLLLLFFLSLVPAATRILIEDTTQQTVLIYGILTLIVTVLMRRLVTALTKQSITEINLQKRRVDELNRQDMLSFIARIIILIIGLFQVHVALVIYLALPILAFLQNMIDREEDRFVDTLDQTEQADYFADRNQIWGSSMKRYSKLLRDSLKDPNEKDSQQWEDIMKEWLGKVDQEIAMRQKAMKTASTHEQEHLQQEINRLQMQKSRLQERENHLEQRPFNRNHPKFQPSSKKTLSKK
ncbi:TMEM175 family protein [Enterococcus montenegrensis]|uniref:TMEM175 family protein n=1 Tax=Enterococcus montenegrensis TaxID=3031993 RepID=UPI00249F5D3E|nr:TMEM175 family protein [Enterococcus montenegrensis]WHA09776.1 TMEM175 family protein [Enterococcus montenegrensis]